MPLTSHHPPQLVRPDRCRVVLVDDRPLVGATLATALRRSDLEVVAICERATALSRTVIHHRPDALVLSNGLTRLSRRLLPGCKAAVTDMATLVVTDTADDVTTLYGAGVVDAVLGPETGIEQLRRAIDRVRTGERFVDGLARPRPIVAGPCIELTGRERQVLHLLATGASTEAISLTLGVSANTVRSHVRAIFGKLGEGRRLRAVRRAEELGLLEPLTA